MPTTRRIPTRGYAQIPNSLIENQAALSNNELRLALIALRRGPSLPVSKSTWTRWTGLHERQLESAVRGLREKGFEVEGRGDSAKFRFQPMTWNTFVTSRDTVERARQTKGRRSVPAKAGAMVHPDCRERGCALMAAQAHEDVSELDRLVSLDSPTPNAQQIARSAAAGAGATPGCAPLPATPNAQHPARSQGALKGGSPAFATPNAQYSARSSGGEAAVMLAWAQSLRFLDLTYPLAGVVFLVQLLELCRSMFPKLTDEELAKALAYAYEKKKRVQYSEGLFLTTVPRALAHFRSLPAPAPPVDRSVGAVRVLGVVADTLRARGAPFLDLVPEVEALASAAAGADLETLDTKMGLLETRIAHVAIAALDDAQRSQVEAEVTGLLKRQKTADLWPAKEREHFAERNRECAALAAFSIPRLDLFYV